MAQMVVESSGARLKKIQSQSKAEEMMDPSMAEMYLAPCKPSEQDRQYENPAEETPCGCQGCVLNPPPKRTYPCRCSGCTPKELPVQPVDTAKKHKSRNGELDVPKSKRLTKVMRERGTKRLLAFRVEVWETADERQTGLFAPSLFFSDEDIKMILDYFALLDSVEHVAALITHNPRLDNQQTLTALYAVICELRTVFDVIAAEKKQKEKEKRAAARQSATAIRESPDSESMESSDESELGNVDMPFTEVASGIKWQLNLRYVPNTSIEQ
jgi:hypothetical protein